MTLKRQALLMGLVQGGLFLVVAFAVSLFAAFPKFAAFGKVSPPAAVRVARRIFWSNTLPLLPSPRRSWP